MKPIKSLLVLAIVCAPVVASAQGYYGRGPAPLAPGGFHNRTGRLAWGFGLGLGGMHDSGGDINCDNCNVQPLALELDFHLGGMLSPRFALLFEAQANAQTLHSDFRNGDTTLTQGAAMIAAQFWLLPQLWIKGGLGFAQLHVDDTFVTSDFGTGGALMAGIGVELMSARNFAIDLQARVIEGTYNSLDTNVTSGTIGIGIDWY